MDGGDVEDNEDEPSSILEDVEEESGKQMSSNKPDLVRKQHCQHVILLFTCIS